MERDTNNYSWHIRKASVWKAYNKYPFVVVDSGRLYVRYGFHEYLLMKREGVSFSVSISPSVKDFHTLMALSTIPEDYPFNGNSTGNFLADVGGSLLGYGLYKAFTPKVSVTREAVRQREATHNLRKCFLDMNCGDLIYDDTLFPLFNEAVR